MIDSQAFHPIIISASGSCCSYKLINVGLTMHVTSIILLYLRLTMNSSRGEGSINNEVISMTSLSDGNNTLLTLLLWPYQQFDIPYMYKQFDIPFDH